MACWVSCDRGFVVTDGFVEVKLGAATGRGFIASESRGWGAKRVLQVELLRLQ